MMNNYILLTIVVLIIGVSIPTVSANYYDDVINHQKNDSWSIGKNLHEKDSFTYTICGESLSSRVVLPYHCFDYTIQFVTMMESYQGSVWIVQGTYSDVDTTKSMILQINPNTFKVSTDQQNKEFGVILEKTIFSLSKYGDKSLSIGTQWDSLDSYFTNNISLEIKREQYLTIQSGNFTTSILGYDIVKESSTYIDGSLPFPVKSTTYSPNIIFPEPKLLFHYTLNSMEQE